MASQKALFITEKKGPWKVGDRPIPKPGQGEVLVRIEATALNPVDWKIQKFGNFVENYPAVIGSDSAGFVEEVGEGVQSFVKGDRVVHQGWFLESDKSTFQQYTIVPAEILGKLPSKISFKDAASIPLGIATAAVGYYNPPDQGGLGLTQPWHEGGKGKYPNTSVVVLGGSSSVGQFAIQLAKLSGFHPIITTSSKTHEDYLKSLGATHVLDRHIDVEVAAKAALPGGQADIVYDAISEDSTQKLAITLLKPDGSLILTLPTAKGLDQGTLTVKNVFGNVHVQRALGANLYKSLTELLDTGDIKPNRVEVLPGGLSGIPDGLERLAANKVSGIKLVALPFE